MKNNKDLTLEDIYIWSKTSWCILGLITVLNISINSETIKKYTQMFVPKEIYAYLVKFFINCKIESVILYLWWIVLISTIVIGIRTICKVKKLDKDQKTKISEESEFEKHLRLYLDSKEERVFLLCGDWGVGKSKSTKDYLKKYFKYDKNRNVSFISCYGLDDRKSLIKEIEQAYGRNDNRVIVKIADFIKHIPILSGFYSIIRPSYNFNDMNKDSIFVFDDFERIGLSYRDDGPKVKYNRPRYDLDSAVENAMLDIEESMYDAREAIRNISLNSRNEKMNIISGIVNDLAENYGMKVIVICNTNYINKDFMRETFEMKMNCNKFEFKTEEKHIESLIDNIVKKSVSNDDDAMVSKFINEDEDKKKIIEAWKFSEINNLRNLQMIMFSFINIIKLSKKTISNETMKDLFYSLFIMNILYNRQNKLKWYDKNLELIEDGIDIKINILRILDNKIDKHFNIKYENEYTSPYIREGKYIVELFEILSDGYKPFIVGDRILYDWICGKKLGINEIEHRILRLENQKKRFNDIMNNILYKDVLLEKYCLQSLAHVYAYSPDEKKDKFREILLNKELIIEEHSENIDDEKILSLIKQMRIYKLNELFIDEEIGRVVVEKIKAMCKESSKIKEIDDWESVVFTKEEVAKRKNNQAIMNLVEANNQVIPIIECT